MSSRKRLNIFSLVMLAIGAVLVYIWESGMLKTDNDYWTVFILLGILVIVGLPVLILNKKKHVRSRREKS